MPIYLGCPNIADFLDPAGMILCEDEADIQAAVRAASETLYGEMLPALRAIKEKAADWGQTFERADRAVIET